MIFIGQSILEPLLTPFNSLHEVFLNFSYPAVTYQPLNSKPNLETSVVETIKNAFDDPVRSVNVEEIFMDLFFVLAIAKSNAYKKVSVCSYAVI